jgi:hypothetical protein
MQTLFCEVFMLFRIRYLVVGVALLSITGRNAPGADAGVQQFIRILRDSSKVPMSLETAIVSYTNSGKANGGTTVDLVGAVHVGEKSYYRDLNRAFREYDAVLYELVAAENTVPSQGQRSGHPVSMLQVSMKSLLGLEFQLDSIDYKQKNFVHADLSPEEFTKSMEKRGESFTKLMFRLMGQGLAQQSADPARSNDLAVLGAFFSKDRSQDLKRVLAQQFEELEKANAVLDGPEGSTIITERNRRAAKVLEQQLQAGKQRVAIFYGAAHLPDFDKRLRSEFNLKPVRERWLEAWNLRSTQASGDKPEKKK